MPTLMDLINASLLRPVTANQNMLNQGERAREIPRTIAGGPQTLAELLQGIGMVPGLGAVGMAGDINQYLTQPETRGAIPYALTAAGAIPGVSLLAKAGKARKLINDAREITEPPVQENMIRLYRGGDARGGHYSPSREVAEQFLFDRGGLGQLRYVDVPNSVANQAALKAFGTGQTIRDESAHILPQVFRAKSKVIAEWEPRSGRLFQIVDE